MSSVPTENSELRTENKVFGFGIGIDLGGTRIKSARFDLETGELLATAMVPTRDGERINEEPAFAVGVRELVKRHESEMGACA